MMHFTIKSLKINPDIEMDRIVDFVTNQVLKKYRRRGIVVGLSGGVDSALMSAIATQALGKDKVVGLILPEKESGSVSSLYARKHAEKLGIEFREIDITPTVESIVPYGRRDEYIRKLIPEYTKDCRYNIKLPTDLLDRDSYNFYVLNVQLPDGSMKTKRLTPDSFRMITAFASVKIRARMIHLYWEAEKRDLVVAGTTNRTEMILGDFCKYGDGGTDIEPLSHLYKDQIFQIARHIGVIPEIINRIPSPDTFSLPVSDQEFYFRIPFEKLDILLFAWEHEVPVAEVSKVLNLHEDAVKRAFRDFTAKKNVTAHLRELPNTVIINPTSKTG
jgi:NAD+ synthase